MVATALVLSACGTSYVASSPKPSATLLAPCVDPDLVADPDTATSEEINVERINVAKAYADCRQGKADLITFIQKTTK